MGIHEDRLARFEGRTLDAIERRHEKSRAGRTVVESTSLVAISTKRRVTKRRTGRRKTRKRRRNTIEATTKWTTRRRNPHQNNTIKNRRNAAEIPEKLKRKSTSINTRTEIR